MQKRILILFFLLINYIAFSQDHTNNFKCDNGIKDSLELGVDCGPECGSCNGEAQIIYNNKEYKTGRIYVQSTTTSNQTGLFIQKNRIVYTSIGFSFSYIRNGMPKNIGISFMSLRLGKIKPQKIYLTGGTDKDFEYINFTQEQRGMIGYFSENFVCLSLGQGIPIRLKNKNKYNYILEITKVDNLERVMSGKIVLLGMTTDGTPIDITGSFNDISF